MLKFVHYTVQLCQAGIEGLPVIKLSRFGVVPLPNRSQVTDNPAVNLAVLEIFQHGILFKAVIAFEKKPVLFRFVNASSLDLNSVRQAGGRYTDILFAIVAGSLPR